MYLKIGDNSVHTLISMVDNQAIDVLLSMIFIGGHIIIILPEARNVFVCDCSPVAVVE